MAAAPVSICIIYELSWCPYLTSSLRAISPWKIYSPPCFLSERLNGTQSGLHPVRNSYSFGLKSICNINQVVENGGRQNTSAYWFIVLSAFFFFFLTLEMALRSEKWGQTFGAWGALLLSLSCPCWQWTCSDSTRKTNVNNCYRHLTSLAWGSWDFSYWDIAHFPDWHHAWTRLWKCLWDEASRHEVEPEHCSIIFNCCPNVKKDEAVRIFLDMVLPKALLSIEVYLVLYSCILSLFPPHHTFSGEWGFH